MWTDVEIPPSQAIQGVQDGFIQDAKSMIALMWLENRLLKGMTHQSLAQSLAAPEEESRQ